jgi:hypothetical protein
VQAKHSHRLAASDSGYAFIVTPHLAAGKSALSFLLVLAVVFAPAPDEVAGPGPPGGTEASLGARILAPTVRQGIQVSDPKLLGRLLQIADQIPWPGPIPLTLTSFAAALLFASLTWFAQRKSSSVPRLVALRARVPRAPPALRTA